MLRDAAGALRGLMDFATSPNSPIAALDRLGVSHGRLTIDDRTIDRAIRYEDVTLSLDKGDNGMRFSAAANGPSGRWTAVAVAKGAPGGRRDFHAQFRNFSIDEISLAGGFRTTALRHRRAALLRPEISRSVRATRFSKRRVKWRSAGAISASTSRITSR